ncbi:hypothetical protein AB1L30_07825 [Bremerella sp. JC817]|uniref:hypothetical protein n=1 Tax=Bremerella sp. JC817 TaxID=3231756 RepID=UPI00345B2430
MIFAYFFPLAAIKAEEKPADADKPWAQFDCRFAAGPWKQAPATNQFERGQSFELIYRVAIDPAASQAKLANVVVSECISYEAGGTLMCCFNEEMGDSLMNGEDATVRTRTFSTNDIPQGKYVMSVSCTDLVTEKSIVRDLPFEVIASRPQPDTLVRIYSKNNRLVFMAGDTITLDGHVKTIRPTIDPPGILCRRTSQDLETGKEVVWETNNEAWHLYRSFDDYIDKDGKKLVEQNMGLLINTVLNQPGKFKITWEVIDPVYKNSDKLTLTIVVLDPFAGEMLPQNTAVGGQN